MKTGANKAFQTAAAWFSILLSAVFVAVGLAILTGLIFSEHPLLDRGIRIIVGLILAGYGIARGVPIYRRIARGRKGAEDD